MAYTYNVLNVFINNNVKTSRIRNLAGKEYRIDADKTLKE